MARNNLSRLGVPQRCYDLLQSFSAGIDQVEATDNSVNHSPSRQTSDVIQRVHQACVATADTHNDPTHCFSPQGKVVFNEIRLHDNQLRLSISDAVAGAAYSRVTVHIEIPSALEKRGKPPGVIVMPVAQHKDVGSGKVDEDGDLQVGRCH
jgi:hypothetical protein